MSTIKSVIPKNFEFYDNYHNGSIIMSCKTCNEKYEINRISFNDFLSSGRVSISHKCDKKIENQSKLIEGEEKI